MRRALVLAAVFAVGLAASLALTARPAQAALDCSTNTAALVAATTPTNLGYGWSSPANPDPLWDVELPSINQGLSVYAPDAAGARSAAKVNLDAQRAALGCSTTTTVASTTTASTTTAATTTAAPSTTTSTVVLLYPVASPPVTTTETTTTTVPAPASVAPAQPPVTVVINLPKPPAACNLTGCFIGGKRVPCSRLTHKAVAH